MGNKINDLIQKLADLPDTDKVLEELKLTAAQAMALLKQRRGRIELAARRRLGALHTSLVARRYSPYAVSRLCELLQEAKPEFRLKGATSLLKASDLGQKKSRKPSRTRVQDATREMTNEDAVLLEVLAAAATKAPPHKAMKPVQSKSPADATAVAMPTAASAPPAAPEV